MRSRAAERRKIHSLGREPQDTDEKKEWKPRSGDRNIAVMPAAHATTQIRSTRFARSGQVCRPLRGLSFCCRIQPWGSRPRLRTCRASGASLHLVHPVWRRFNLRCQPIAGRDLWEGLGTGNWLLGGRSGLGTGYWVLGGRVGGKYHESGIATRRRAGYIASTIKNSAVRFAAAADRARRLSHDV